MYTKELLSISVINVSKDNLQLLETPKKYAFIKLENISNKDIEEMICYGHFFDFGDIEFNQNTFFWNKKLKECKICV